MEDDPMAFVCTNVGDQSSPIIVMSSSTASFSNLREELLLSVAGYLPPRDLLRFQCVSKELFNLNTESIWERRCEERWEPWPRYQLTDEKRNELDSAGSATFRMTWKRRYFVIEEDATIARSTKSEMVFEFRFVGNTGRGSIRSRSRRICLR